MKTTLDAKYTHRDSTKPGVTEKEEEKEDEYNPRISVKYSHALTRWTSLSGEAKFDYKEEKNKDQISEKVTRTKEPQIELSLKSLIYELKTGFKETWNLDKPTENRAFGHLLIQPSGLPELRVDYDHDETKNQLKKDRITLGAIYKPSKILRIKLDFKHEYSDYFNEYESTPNIEDYNLNGEIKFNHTLSTRCPIKTEISYKAEKLYQEEQPKEQQPIEKQKKFMHTLRGKLSYRPTKKTNISLEYENKVKDDRKKENAEDKSDQDIQFDISQNFTDWLEVRGWIRKESEEEQDPNDKTTDTEKTTVNGHIRLVPKKCLQLNLKVIDEKSEETDPNKKIDKRIYEASLRSDFPNLLRSYQTLDFKRVNEEKQETPFSEEERLMWKWSLSPIENLSLKPEYIHSVANKKNTSDGTPSKDITDEYKFNFSYDFSVHDIWAVDLSHVTSRKSIETRSNGSSVERKETNNDSSLEVDFQPYESLFITSQITRKHYSIKHYNIIDDQQDDELPNEEMSYSFKYDWSFMPFTWSTSYKYDDKKQQDDTETFESKILCDFTDYTIEVEYKFTQTFMSPEDNKDNVDKEDIVTLRLKATF